MAKRDRDILGPYIRWMNYGYEGWQPSSYDTIKEAIEDENYGCQIAITKPIKYEVKDLDA